MPGKVRDFFNGEDIIKVLINLLTEADKTQFIKEQTYHKKDSYCKDLHNEITRVEEG